MHSHLFLGVTQLLTLHFHSRYKHDSGYHGLLSELELYRALSTLSPPVCVRIRCVARSKSVQTLLTRVLSRTCLAHSHMRHTELADDQQPPTYRPLEA